MPVAPVIFTPTEFCCVCGREGYVYVCKLTNYACLQCIFYVWYFGQVRGTEYVSNYSGRGIDPIPGGQSGTWELKHYTTWLAPERL